MRNNLIFLLLCSTFIVGAQTKTFKGKVYADNADVTGVVIQNTTTERATITDLDGNFSIQVRLNDTLVFSAVQFKRKLLPVTKALWDSPFVVVPLEEFINELQGVTVNPYNLSGRLDADITGLKLEKDVSAEALELPNANVKIITQNERKLYEASTGSGLVPLNPIINAITGRTKMLKNRVKVNRVYARTQRVQQFYVDSIFMTDLRLPKDKIPDFMYFCEVDEQFQQTVDTHDKLKIWEFLVQKSAIYRRENGLE